jgi:hypothetical protein
MPISKWTDPCEEGSKCTNGFVDPIDFIENHSPASCETRNVVSQINYFWIAGHLSNKCEFGLVHYRIEEGPTQCAVIQVSSFEACAAIRGTCQRPTEDTSTDSRVMDFLKSIFGRKANASSDFPDVDLSTLCNETVLHTSVCMNGDSVESIFSNDSGLLVSYPGTAIGIGQIKPDPLPNLQIRKVEVHLNDNLLTEEKSYLKVGETVEIRIWPVSKEADCEHGVDADVQNVETDTFYKIAMDESLENEGKFLDKLFHYC